MTALNYVPPITHPYGQHWEQPARDRILMDETHALMDAETFTKLSEYSTSYPSGVYDGKMWRRNEGMWLIGGKQYLCWYGPSAENPDCCEIFFREIIVV